MCDFWHVVRVHGCDSVQPFSLRRKTSQQYESLAERVDAAEERLEEVEDQVNDDTSLTKSIFNKIDDLSDFVRNKIVLKKDKVKPF